MTIDRRAATPAALAFAASLMTPAAAQTAQDTPPPPRGLESLAPQAVPVPPAPVIILPVPTPAPSATPAPRATPRPRPTRAAPESTPAAAAAPRPAPAPSPTPTPLPAGTKTPAAEATPAAAPAPQPEPTLAAPDTGRMMPIWILPAIIVFVLAGLWALNRRRRDVPEPVVEPQPIEPVPPEPLATPAVVAAPVAAESAAPQFFERTVAAAPRARLMVEMRPLRAGLNLLSAVADCELVVTNTGDAPAEGIRTQVTLLTVHTALDADLAALTAAPIGRPTTPPFSLAPGESRTIKAIAATPRDAIRTMTAANRPMFVPIVSVNVLYPDGQTTRAWAIGIERVDSAKLAPFWFDAPPKMYTDIGARPHAAAFER
jgi:hypothetical protein